jgi:hypothetical protein
MSAESYRNDPMSDFGTPNPEPAFSEPDPVVSPFLPLLLLALCLCGFLAWQLVLACSVRGRLDRQIDENVKTVARSQAAQRELTELASGVLQLASQDPACAALARKYEIAPAPGSR